MILWCARLDRGAITSCQHKSKLSILNEVGKRYYFYYHDTNYFKSKLNIENYPLEITKLTHSDMVEQGEITMVTRRQVSEDGK